GAGRYRLVLLQSCEPARKIGPDLAHAPLLARIRRRQAFQRNDTIGERGVCVVIPLQVLAVAYDVVTAQSGLNVGDLLLAQPRRCDYVVGAVYRAGGGE